jgi:hypothetical protein
VRQLIVESKQRELYVVHGDRSLARYDIANKTDAALMETVDIAPEGQRVTALAMLSGGFSLIVGTDKGELAQWFLVRTEGTNFALKAHPRLQAHAGGGDRLAPEFFRKGFIAGDEQGHLGSYFATSQRLLFVEKLSISRWSRWACRRAATATWRRTRPARCFRRGGEPLPRSVVLASCGRRSGTRATRSPTTSGSPRPPTPTSSPSSASRR